MTYRLQTFFFALGLAASIALLYAMGLSNQLVFDDARLTDGSIFGRYGNLLEPQVRMLSYGTFVWIKAILGESWKAQRIVNIGLHIATAFVLYRLVIELLKQTQWNEETKNDKDYTSKLLISAQIGTALWALNPMAVYAVSYLVQRSILMATLFVVSACLCFIFGLQRNQSIWFFASLIFYILGIASKEYAITAVILLVPLYVFIRRPSLQLVLRMLFVSISLALIAGLIFYFRYAGIFVSLFDETSRAFALQLEQQTPGISEHLYALSIQNQARFFFNYGAMWFLPYVGWMSIDIRPTFPTSILSWHTLGLLAYISTLSIGVWAVLKRRDAWSLIGLSVLIPGLMFVTEFGTIWVQDPFVLYRSYLWSWCVPIIIATLWFFLSSAMSRQSMYITGVIFAISWSAMTIERIDSLSTATDAWVDAANKVDMNAPPNAVGRWRPYLNLSYEHIKKGNHEEALRMASLAESLGEPFGWALFNMGESLQQLNQHPNAINSFNKAAIKGFNAPVLYFQKAESEVALHRFEDALSNYEKALSLSPNEESKVTILARRAETALSVHKSSIAINDYLELNKLRPNGQRYQIGLAMALMENKDFSGALKVLNKSLQLKPTAQLYYARALIEFNLGNLSASRTDLEQALKAEPNNPTYQGLDRRLQGDTSLKVSGKKP